VSARLMCRNWCSNCYGERCVRDCLFFFCSEPNEESTLLFAIVEPQRKMWNWDEEMIVLLCKIHRYSGMGGATVCGCLAASAVVSRITTDFGQFFSE
jgi:hypothetical protein